MLRECRRSPKRDRSAAAGAPTAQVLATHLTHLILFSAEPAADGSLLGLDRLPRPELLREARAAATARDAKLLVCFGGNGRSAGFGPMVASKSARAKFVANVVDLVKQKKLDGVDYNWEYLRRVENAFWLLPRPSRGHRRNDGARLSE